MKTYSQYCPIARASEVVAQRWTPIIIRNLLNGPSTYSDLADQTPGIPRSLLTSRLRELQSLALVEHVPGADDRGHVYRLTEPGKDLAAVINAMGSWGERWLDVTPEHADPIYFLNSWVNTYLNYDELPTQRVVVRFDLIDQPAKLTPMWVIFDQEDSEVCRDYPGYEEDLIVTAESVALAEWHLGRLEWKQAIATGRVAITGIPRLARALPNWNRRSVWTSSTHPTKPAT